MRVIDSSFYLRIADTAEVGSHCIIGRGVDVAHGVQVGDDVLIGPDTHIGPRSIIGDKVRIGPDVGIEADVFIMHEAQVCPNPVYSKSTNARTIQAGSTIGPRVLLHDEVELGPQAIIPSQRTIASIGNLGSKNRVVTIYGAMDGPLYSVGCQIGITFAVLRERVFDSTATSPESAATYAPYLGVFSDVGRVVQDAYDSEESLIEEILGMRAIAARNQRMSHSPITPSSKKQ